MYRPTAVQVAELLSRVAVHWDSPFKIKADPLPKLKNTIHGIKAILHSCLKENGWRIPVIRSEESGAHVYPKVKRVTEETVS
jgi:hypothetical protein